MLQDLWGTGRSDFKGDCHRERLGQPAPVAADEGDLRRAGDAGMAFSAQHADYNFALARGQHANGLCPDRRTHDAGGGKTGRDVGSYVLFMVIADETDEAARAKWEHYKAGADEETGVAHRAESEDTRSRQ